MVKRLFCGLAVASRLQIFEQQKMHRRKIENIMKTDFFSRARSIEC
jgi:hypothetical protein